MKIRCCGLARSDSLVACGQRNAVYPTLRPIRHSARRASVPAGKRAALHSNIGVIKKVGDHESGYS